MHRVKCGECGGAFQTPIRSVRYCSDACRQRGYAARGNRSRLRLPPHAWTAECRECGRAFRTPNRAIRYCSEPCRGKGYARHGRAPPPPLSRQGPRPSRAPAPASVECKCRECGRPFMTDRGPGKPRVYCSAACRADGLRARAREGMRRYLSDPRKRALQAARVGAIQARRRAEAARKRERRVQCGSCGAEFATTIRNALYCSAPCRKKAAVLRGRAHRRSPAELPATAKCRVCSAEFEPGHGNGRLRLYCSRACQADGVRAANSEYVRRRYGDAGGRAAGVLADARAKGGRGAASGALRLRCKECGALFSAASRAIRYCSNKCWKTSRNRRSDAASRRRRELRLRRAGRGGRAGTAQAQAEAAGAGAKEKRRRRRRRPQQ